MPPVPDAKKTPERWVVVTIDEAYVHCSKHIPMLQHADPEAESGRRAGDVFKAKNVDRAWLQPTCAPEVEERELEPVIGQATLTEDPAPTHSPSGRVLPLPIRK